MELNPFELQVSKELTTERVEYHNYRSLIGTISEEVTWIIEAGFKEYQGDYFFLGKDAAENLYYVVGGYGSCSGCDALESCNSLEELTELRDDIKRNIRKFDSAQEFESWFNEHAQREYYEFDDVAHFIKSARDTLGVNLKWRDFDI